MMAYLHLALTADPIWKALADDQGRVLVQEHWPDNLIDGEDAYSVEWAALSQQQRIFLVEMVVDKVGLPVREAEQRCRFGWPISRGQAIAIEVDGQLWGIDQTVYAPESPTPWGDFDPEEVA